MEYYIFQNTVLLIFCIFIAGMSCLGLSREDNAESKMIRVNNILSCALSVVIGIGLAIAINGIVF